MINLFLKYSVSEQNPTILVFEPFSKHALRGEGGEGDDFEAWIFFNASFLWGGGSKTHFYIRSELAIKLMISDLIPLLCLELALLLYIFVLFL